MDVLYIDVYMNPNMYIPTPSYLYENPFCQYMLDTCRVRNQ